MAESTKRYKKLVNNTAIMGIGQIGSKILVYLLVRLYTSVMTQSDYSIASNITETATLLIPIISLGIGDAVYCFGMDKQYSRKDVFTSGFVVFAMGSLLFSIVIPILCAIPYMEGREWLVVVYVLCSVLHTLCSQYLRAKGQFKLYAVQGLLNTMLTIICNIIFLLPLNMSYVGYVLSVAVADFLSTVFMVIVGKLWKEFDLRSVSLPTMKDMLKYSIPMIPATIFWWVTNVSDRYMVTAFLGDAVNGLYSASYKIPTLLMVLSGIFVNAWSNSAVDEKDAKDSAHFYEKVMESFSAIIFIMGGGIIAFAQIITRLMFAKDFYDAWVYIPVLTLAMVFFNLVNFLGSLYIVEKKSIYSFLTSLAGAAVNVALNLLLIPTELGALGAAIATLVSFIVSFILRAISAGKILSFNQHIGKTVVNSLILAAQAVVIMTGFTGWIWVEGALLVLLVAINLPPLLSMLKLLIGNRLTPRKK